MSSLAKARIGLYSTKGDTLTRTHRTCPKCGAGTFLAEHANRRSCGHCGYMETKAPETRTPPVAAPPKPEGKAPRPKAPKPAAPAPPG